jgi:hypothetical protein
MAKTNNQFNEPNEMNDTIDVNHEEIIDPIMAGKTVDRGYSGATVDPNVINGPLGEIPEPIIIPPNFDDPIDDAQFQDVDQDLTVDKPKKPKEEDDDDDFGFELNGETAVYLLDFLYKLFKEQYKIGTKTLEKYELDPETFKYRIEIDGERMTVGQFSEQVNAAIDEINISAKDKNQIKKIVTILSKKHDIKMSAEAQLLVVLGKIGFETHLQLKMFQAAFLEKLTVMQPEYRSAQAEEAPTPDEAVNNMQKVYPTEDDNTTYVRVQRKKRGPYRKKNKDIEIAKVAQFKEPGEK